MTTLLKRPWMSWIRVVLPIVVMILLAGHFYRSLSALDDLDAGAMIASIPVWAWCGSGTLYLVGISASAFFWRLLLNGCGHNPPFISTIRAFFVSQAGKYAPGKGLALLIRAALLRTHGVPMTLSLATGIIEVLWTMAVGSLFALTIYTILECTGSSSTSADPWLPFKLLALTCVTAVPAYPAWSIRLARASARKLGLDPGEFDFRLGWQSLLAGAAVLACGWICLTLSLIVLIAGMAPAKAFPLILPAMAWVPLASVGGFVASTPGGIGVREYLIEQALLPHLGANQALLAALLLRLIWTVAEAVAALVLWLGWRDSVPMQVQHSNPADQKS